MTFTRHKREEKIINILTDIRPDIDFMSQKSLIDNGILESFDVILIVSTFMEEFDVYIDADDIEPENLNSFQQMCSLIQRKINDK